MTTKKNTYFQTGELEELLKNLEKLKPNTEHTNAYDLFIAQCRDKIYPEGTITEKHHIKPKHSGGTNEPSNLINLSIKDHITAHWLLWQLFNSKKDEKAYIFRVSTPEERVLYNREEQSKRLKEWKEKGKGFWNSKFQSEQGKKGGSKGGSAGTDEQFKARQQVGKKYGPITGKQNQSPELKEFLTKYSIWEFKGCKTVEGRYQSKGKKGQSCPPDMTEENFKVLVEPKETFYLTTETLNLFAPGSIEPKNVATMYKLIDSQKRIYGWSLIKTLTRSEVEAGALTELPFDFFIEDTIPE
jgi:hypothetical protein